MTALVGSEVVLVIVVKIDDKRCVALYTQLQVMTDSASCGVYAVLVGDCGIENGRLVYCASRREERRIDIHINNRAVLFELDALVSAADDQILIETVSLNILAVVFRIHIYTSCSVVVGNVLRNEEEQLIIAVFDIDFALE